MLDGVTIAGSNLKGWKIVLKVLWGWQITFFIVYFAEIFPQV